MQENNVIQQILKHDGRTLKRALLYNVTSDLNPKEIFSLMRASVKSYTSDLLWEILLTKVFLLNHEEKESVKSNCCAFSSFKKEEFKKFKEIEKSVWEKLVDKGAFNSIPMKSNRLNAIMKLFNKVKTLTEKNYDKSLFSREEMECCQLLLHEVGAEKLRLKFLNKPKGIFQKKIKALEKSIKEIKETGKNEKLIKNITKFLVTGELKTGDDFLSKHFISIYNIAIQHNMRFSLEAMNKKFDLSTQEGQGLYMAKWLLENLDFAFKRKVSKKDKDLFSKVPDRSTLKFQQEEKQNAIFTFYEYKHSILTTKGLKEDQCDLMVLNPVNLRYYENNNMDTEHATSFNFIQAQLNGLLKYLNDKENVKFKKAFLGLKSIYGNNNKWEISNFFAEKDGKVLVTGLLCTLAYNNISNLWLLSHGMNTQKSAKDTIKWLKSLGNFGEQCLEAIKESGGVHDGPLMQWVYHADKNCFFEIKFQVPFPQGMSFALSDFTSEQFVDLSDAKLSDWEKIKGFDKELFSKIQSLKSEENEAYKTCLFSSKESKFLKKFIIEKKIDGKIKEKKSNEMMTITKKLEMPAVIDIKTQARDKPKGLGEFILNWFLKSEVGEIQISVAKDLFEDLITPARQELIQLRLFDKDHGLIFSDFTEEKFEKLAKIIEEKKPKKITYSQQELFKKIESVKGRKGEHKALDFSSEETKLLGSFLKENDHKELGLEILKKNRDFKHHLKNIKKKIKLVVSDYETFKEERNKIDIEFEFSSQSTSTQEEENKEVAEFRKAELLRLWYNHPYKKLIRKHVKIFAKALYPGNEKEQKVFTEKLLGDKSNVKLVLLSTEDIKKLAEYVKNMEKEMLETPEFKNPEVKSDKKSELELKKKFVENIDNISSKYSEKFLLLARTKEQRELEDIKEDNKNKDQVIKQKDKIIEEKNKKLQEKDQIIEEKDHKLREKDEENKKLKEELERFKRERELSNSKENDPNKKTKTENNEKDSEEEHFDNPINIVQGIKEIKITNEEDEKQNSDDEDKGNKKNN